MPSTRFHISRHAFCDSPRLWWGVTDLYAQAANPLGGSYICALRTTRKAAENFVARLWREIRTERASNRRRRIREMEREALSRAPINPGFTRVKALKFPELSRRTA